MGFSLTASAEKAPVFNVKQILIIKHGALGDLIQAIGVVMDIRQHHKHCHITLLTSPAYASLMQRCTYIDAIIVDERAAVWRLDLLFKLKRRLQKQRFDCVYDLQNSSRTHWYHQYWFQHNRWIGRGKNEAAPVSGLAGLLNLLEQANIRIQHSHLADLSWMQDDVTDILNKHHINKPFIALIPGSSPQHPAKRWPYFAELAALLMQRGFLAVTILGPAETGLGKSMPGAVLTGLNWFQLAGVLNAAHYVIGNDTGPSHLASHLNKPGVALFGASSSAARSEIGHRHFTTLQVTDLAALSANEVCDYVMKKCNIVTARASSRWQSKV